MNEVIQMRNEAYSKGLKDLINVIKQTHPRVMVEIGSYQGESTAIFAEMLPNTIIYAIDPWMNGYDKKDISSEQYDMSLVEQNFDERTKLFSNVKKIKNTSLEAVKLFDDNSLDFVYVDGIHRYDAVTNDLNAWLPKLKKKRYVGGHDYLERCFMRVVRAVNDKVGKPDQRFEDTSWLKFVK